MRNVNDLGTGVSAWYLGLPPFTRTYLTGIVLATVMSFTLGVLNLRWIALDWKRVVTKFEVGGSSGTRMHAALREPIVTTGA